MRRAFAALLLLAAAQAQAAITLVGASTAADAFTAGGGSATATVSVSVPTGMVTGDMMYACVSGYVSSDGQPTLNTPTGWTAIANETYYSGGSDHALGVYQCSVDTCTSSSYGFVVTRNSGTGAVQGAAGMIALRGASSTLDVTYASGSHRVQSANTDNPDQPDITTVTNYAWALGCYGATSAPAGMTAGAPSGMTLRTSKFTNDGRKMALASIERATAGAYAPGVWTHTGGTSVAESQAVTFAVAPSASGCAVGRSSVTITSVANNTDPDNITCSGATCYGGTGQSPAIAASQDTVCYEAVTDVLGDTVTVTADGWVVLSSEGETRSDNFEYCYLDNGAACAADATYEITQTPILVAEVATAVTASGAAISTTSDQLEGTIYACVQASSVATPSHAQIAAGNNGAGAACTYPSSDATPSSPQPFTASGLTGAISYEACFGQANAATPALQATVVCSDAFTTVAAGDTTPTAFSFTALSRVAAGSAQLSSEVTVAGIDAAANVSVSGCQWQKNTGAGFGAATSAVGTVVVGNLVRLSVDASSEGADTTTCTLTIGGVSGTWSVTTASGGLPDLVGDTIQQVVQPHTQDTVQ